ncbi:uncharacterized protein LOC132304452 [Cornus florida]|uniref:uncharacterized protein LOC132304452 n=1 Tax=Cornus florida TaxID=4283 RepID=UPI00289CADEF|nr:uncharacterized protein LOC132304452 [Cornus florida]
MQQYANDVMEVPIHGPASKESYLFTNAKKGAWNEVVKLYKDHPEVHKLKVNTAGDTLLHIVVSEGKQDVVVGLVWALSTNVEALRVKNERGNTPLHVAASLGLDRMCDCIASKDSELIGVRNNKGETPFFLAAQRGNRDAFLRLHSICGTERGYEYCRGNGGETVLHSTVRGDHFDLAFQIIIRYDKLVNHIDGQGLFPLHLLANNPSAFRSGSDLGRFKQFIYDHCISVVELSKAETSYDQLNGLESEVVKVNPINTQGNYHTCINFFRLFVTFGKNTQENDAEAYGNGLVNRNQQAFRDRLYGKCIKLISKMMKIFVPSEIRKIKMEKEKHTWSVQVMKELLNRDSPYNYDVKPKPPSSTSDGTDTVVKQPNNGMESKVSPFLVAVKQGIIEVVQENLECNTLAIYDTDSDGKNAVLLAAEYRQPRIYNMLLNLKAKKKGLDAIFGEVDNNGNTALHLAAIISPFLTAAAPLQMQREINWYLFVKKSVPLHLHENKNNAGKTSKEVFIEQHEDLFEAAVEWYKSTSTACLVVATLIATVAFTTSTTVPGGANQDTGSPVLENQPAFLFFAISSLFALCFSVISIILFVSLSAFPSKHRRELGSFPHHKFVLALTSLLASIVAMLGSFCASHFLLVKEKLSVKAFPLYVFTCLVVYLFVIRPLYDDFIKPILGIKSIHLSTSI